MGEENLAVIKAHYESMRIAVLTSYMSHPTMMAEAYAYAWFHRLPPIGLTDEERVFEAVQEYSPRSLKFVIETLDALLSTADLETLSYRDIGRAVRAEDDPNLPKVLSYYFMAIGRKGYPRVFFLDAFRRDLPEGVKIERNFPPGAIRFPS